VLDTREQRRGEHGEDQAAVGGPKDGGKDVRDEVERKRQKRREPDAKREFPRRPRDEGKEEVDADEGPIHDRDRRNRPEDLAPRGEVPEPPPREGRRGLDREARRREEPARDEDPREEALSRQAAPEPPREVGDERPPRHLLRAHAEDRRPLLVERVLKRRVQP